MNLRVKEILYAVELCWSHHWIVV